MELISKPTIVTLGCSPFRSPMKIYAVRRHMVVAKLHGNRLIETLRGLRLGGRDDALDQQLAGPAWREIPFKELIEHLISSELQLRRNRKVDRIRKMAKLRHDVWLENVDFSPYRGLDKAVITSLMRCEWVRHSGDGHRQEVDCMRIWSCRSSL